MTSGVWPVRLNVYDLHESNSWLQHVGLGMYHSGLEINGVEYTFSEAGVGQHPPQLVAGDGISYKSTEYIGDFIGSVPEMRQILNGLKQEGGFKEGEYDVVRNNCNRFCDEFAFALVGTRIPPWVNRAGKGGAAAAAAAAPAAAAAGGGRGGAAPPATASAPPSRDRKELTQKQRELLSKMRSSKSSAPGKGGSVM
ncbi:unnamed protein product [Pylaiella littoralis]